MLVVAILSAIIVIITGLVFQGLYPGQPVTALSYAALFLLILESPVSYLIHIFTNTSLYIYKRKEGKKINYIRHLIVPSISTILLIFAIFIAVDYNLSVPYVYGIYGALVWIIITVVVTLVVRKKYNKKLELIGDFSL